MKNEIKNVISNEEYVFKGTLTLCILTLKNGFIVTGESACLDDRNYDKEKGKQIAFARALDKVLAFEGYSLKQSIFEMETNK